MKNLVLCFDSTTNRPGPHDATNAETLFRLLAADDDRQLTWYDAGEAVLNSARLLNPAARRLRRNTATAARESVIDAYFGSSCTHSDRKSCPVVMMSRV